MLRERAPERAWEVAPLALRCRFRGLLFLGELSELVAEVERSTRAAEEQGDALSRTAAWSVGRVHAHLLAGRPEEARRASERGLAGWTTDGWSLARYEDLRAQILCDLYEGDGARALARVDEERRALKASRLLVAESERVPLFSLLAAAALQAEEPSAAGRWGKRLAREPGRFAEALAAAARAGRLALRRPDDAAAAYEQAAARLDALDMPLFAAAARRRRGQLTGGDEGAALVREVDALLMGRGVAEPERWARMLVP